MPKKSNSKTKSSNRDELLDLLQSELNKANKGGGKIAYTLNEEDNPTDVSEWISTGSSILDLA